MKGLQSSVGRRGLRHDATGERLLQSVYAAL